MIKVDGNLIATNLPVKDLTPGQYALLTTAQRNNGTIYFVSDNPSSNEEKKLMFNGQCIATSTRFRDITTAAYNLLSTAEKNDGTVYFITDYDFQHDILTRGLTFVGDTTVFADYADGTLCGIIADLYDRLDRMFLSSNVTRTQASMEYLSVSAVNGLPIPSHVPVHMSDYGGTDPT